MKRLRAITLCGVLPVVLTAILNGHARRAAPTSDCESRATTAMYQDPNVAIAAGYVPTGECVAVPGLGTMGRHRVNPTLLTTDPATLDPSERQALL